MTMKLIFEVTVEDNILVGFTEDETLAETLIIDRFYAAASEGDELVMTIIDGVKTYTIRTLVNVPGEDEDELEYVDNDGNPITADGQDIVESDDLVDDVPEYEFNEEFLWAIHTGEPDKDLNVSQQSMFLIDIGHGSPFERDENLAIIAAKRG